MLREAWVAERAHAPPRRSCPPTLPIVSTSSACPVDPTDLGRTVRAALEHA